MSDLNGTYPVTVLRGLEMEKRLAERVFDNTIEGIFITNARAEIEQVNRAFSEITGYSADEVLGKKPDLLRSGHHDEQFYQQMWRCLHEQGEWQGEVWNRRKDGSVYLQWLSANCICDEQGQVCHYVAVFHDLSEIRAKEARISHLVNHDPLTGLGNRHQLLERLHYLTEFQQNLNDCIAVMMFDLGEIQLINDSFDHSFADQLIRDAATRLRDLLPDDITLTRMGADEFAVLVSERSGQRDITSLAVDIREALQQPFHRDGHTVYMNPSLGIALYPDDAENADELLRCARAALQEAKLSGRNLLTFYSEAMKMCLHSRQRLLIEQALKEAVCEDKLSINFQPKVSLVTGRVSGAEALIRWEHHELGYVSPADFIPLAEKSGLIVDIGQWVIDEVCRQLVAWRAVGLPLPRIAINISLNQLERDDFALQLFRTVESYQLSPNLLELEVTETGLMRNEDSMVRTLLTLRQYGFNLALDDFGTGFSSLASLRKLPLSTLKIDRAFIADICRDPMAESIVHTIIKLARDLRLELVAEGVENQGQAERLCAMGCEVVQGFHFFRPMPAQEYARLLKQQVGRQG